MPDYSDIETRLLDLQIVSLEANQTSYERRNKRAAERAAAERRR
jgi:hypothetical protein